MKDKILVVEDDAAILSGLVDLLAGEGFEVCSATDGNEALRVYQARKPDLILLDIMIPEKSGYDVCKQIRHHDLLTPIVMLTAKGQEVDKVIGLEIGADDYIVKPFGVNELLARVRAVLRRSRARATARKRDDRPIEFGNVRIDPKTLTGKKGKKEFHVTLREVYLMQFFSEHDGEVVAKLRQKIERDVSDPKHIVTVHGVGYRFLSNPS
jgi:DNA-binding response OmpR family regulator